MWSIAEQVSARYASVWCASSPAIAIAHLARFGFIRRVLLSRDSVLYARRAASLLKLALSLVYAILSSPAEHGAMPSVSEIIAMITILPRIGCVDGFSFSVQAHQFAYCEPRNNVGPYISVEVGFPSDRLPADWNSYAVGPVDEADVYAYVPIEMVTALVAEHGGLDVASLFVARNP